MFSDAVRVANGFTFPYVGLRRRPDGTVFSTLAAFVVLNADGWALTAGHVVEETLAVARQADPPDGSPKATGVAQHTEVWAVPGFLSSKPRLVEARVDPVADLALVRLEPCDGLAECVPVLRDTAQSPIAQGMSVCRVGFPFHDVSASFDEARSEFDIGAGAFPVPSFALPGTVSRFNRRIAGGRSALFIETSTPGLRGQSGGPLLDVSGRLCGIQSHTEHIDLGFDAQYRKDGELVVERQFLNVGAAAHVDEIRRLLDEAEVRYSVG